MLTLRNPALAKVATRTIRRTLESDTGLPRSFSSGLVPPSEAFAAFVVSAAFVAFAAFVASVDSIVAMYPSLVLGDNEA
jgi:hypothetical protein